VLVQNPDIALVGMIVTAWAVMCLVMAEPIAKVEVRFRERLGGFPVEDLYENQVKFTNNLGKVTFPLGMVLFAIGIALKVLH
jgi:multisubunit Na+/H+ antiporter MnhB subunit